MAAERLNDSPAQAGVDDQLRFETLMTELSAKFVSVTSASIDHEIVEAQKDIVRALGLDRSTLVQLRDDERFVATHSWQLPGLQPFPGFAVKDLPWMASAILRGDVVCFSRIDDLPEEAVSERQVARKFGPRSNLTFPLKVGGRVIGAMAFGTVRHQREWPDVVVNRLRVFVEIIGSALARTRAEDEIQRALEEVKRLRDQLQRENMYLQQEIKTVRGCRGLVGESYALRRVLEQVEQVAHTNSSVLLVGETGTGKELIANALHELSPRRDRPMVRLNCAAIPATLIESELFGREKGAYTGALSRQAGRFEVAHRSTLFLDEVGELPLEVQVKLLRALQEKQVERLGSSKSISFDVRIIAATNRDLDKEVRERRFRDDLYYRLNVFPIRMPALRERPEDIPLLVQSFVHEFAKSFCKPIESVDQGSLRALQLYPWPGNIRELRNTVERAMILANGSRLFISPPSDSSNNSAPSLLLSDAERGHLCNVLAMTGWRVRGKDGAAELLGVKPTTLDSMLVRHGIAHGGEQPKSLSPMTLDPSGSGSNSPASISNGRRADA
ncbi:sigma 54-interacting transcriptional regulator [Tunturiibacter gelidoferens]|uniref:Transcriptional regulator with GAF, ATPase, and Fis domain n=1 Tax=Tunturiibacter gelidiferens TaxID=3069689 RepID=A0ACC5NZY4_9BACT|nr:sigma 54-interacting transcriptional regulator [Edaphobacter lichenicola]MBB5340117.1 transcriptional regulator with GAF, ATPase, and Fis domain [Edaphobacter lichenicola]